jgi:nicotinamidase-related amidase
MPLDLTPHLNPATTAVIALEVQENLVLPERSYLPGIAAHATQIGLVDRLATLLDSARRVGAQVIYVIDQRREDGLGGAENIMVRAANGERAAFSHGPIVSDLKPHAEDIVITREHGMSGFFTTPLDQYLRNLGITNTIITGVSANIAVNSTSIEAMNRGYRVIVPRDCIAGDPPEFVEQLLRYVIRNVALVGTAEQIMEYWKDLPART